MIGATCSVNVTALGLPFWFALAVRPHIVCASRTTPIVLQFLIGGFLTSLALPLV